jgi:hypothetical protein
MDLHFFRVWEVCNLQAKLARNPKNVTFRHDQVSFNAN